MLSAKFTCSNNLSSKFASASMPRGFERSDGMFWNFHTEITSHFVDSWNDTITTWGNLLPRHNQYLESLYSEKL